MSGELKVFYDEEEDILYLAREGEEVEFIEVQPGINLELNKDHEIVGIEIMKASKILKEVIAPLQEAIKLRGAG